MTVDSDQDFEDADLTHPWAAQHRIPLVEHQWPHWKYEVALVRPNDADSEFLLLVAVWPTEEEAALIGRYITWRREYYREHWQAKMLKRPLDVDSGTNTQILMKTEHGWHYRLASWNQGLMPLPEDEQIPPTIDGLIALLDRINNMSARWREDRERVTKP